MEPQSPNSSYFISTKRTRVYLSRSAEASAGRPTSGPAGSVRSRGRDRSRPPADLCSFHGSPILLDVALRIDRHDDFAGDGPTFHAAPVIDRVMAGSDHRNDGGARIIPTKGGGPDKSPSSIGFAAGEIGAYPAGEELRADAAHDGRGAHLIDADPERRGDAWLQRGGNRVRDPVTGAAGAIDSAGGASGILERHRRESDQVGEKYCTNYRRHEASPGIGEARGEPLAELSSRFDGEAIAEPIPANPSSGGGLVAIAHGSDRGGLLHLASGLSPRRPGATIRSRTRKNRRDADRGQMVRSR
jgi:hypothetical protein